VRRDRRLGVEQGAGIDDERRAGGARLLVEELFLPVGPAGDEIHTDEFGRVRVQFPWDREGNSDERSSCWVRVSQGWAGAGFGMMNVPRVGQEVLVAFMDGNPDLPIVVGRAFNATARIPYSLPAEKTLSYWRTSSTPGATPAASSCSSRGWC